MVILNNIIGYLLFYIKDNYLIMDGRNSQGILEKTLKIWY